MTTRHGYEIDPDDPFYERYLELFGSNKLTTTPSENRFTESDSAQPADSNSRSDESLEDLIVDAAYIQHIGEDIPMLCGPYIAAGASHLLFGTRGIGKSTLLFGLAAAIALGEPWHGLDCAQANVLYVDVENGSVIRSQKLHRLYPEGFCHESRLFFLARRLRFPDEAGKLLDLAAKRQISLIIFDTLRRCFAVRDENDNAEFYSRVAPVIDSLKEQGIATLLIAHPPKGIAHSARGAGAQEDAVDVVLSLTMQQGLVTDANGIVALSVTKHRLLGLGLPALSLKRAGEDKFEVVDQGNGGNGNAPKTKHQLCQVAIVRLLSDPDTQELKYGDLLARLGAMGFTQGTLKAALGEMVKNRALVREGAMYRLPDPFGPDTPYYDELYEEAFPADQ